jgi:hypothetical protein
MKISNQPTEYLLIQASTPEFDKCDFAIIHLSEQWKERQRERFEMAKQFTQVNDFICHLYTDTDVNFYCFSDKYPGIQKWLSENEMLFVELENDEQKEFSVPANRLYSYELRIRDNGDAYYKAYGKYTEDEFYTNTFSVEELINRKS